MKEQLYGKKNDPDAHSKKGSREASNPVERKGTRVRGWSTADTVEFPRV